MTETSYPSSRAATRQNEPQNWLGILGFVLAAMVILGVTFSVPL